MFFYVWTEVYEQSNKEAHKQWRKYVKEREQAGQPVDPNTGNPVFRETRFDPLSEKEQAKADREAKKLQPKPKRTRKRKKKRKR